MTKRIVISGFGGQGVLTLGNVIAEIGLNKGYNVTWMPSYGAEMRGGTANCSVILSDKIIGSPMVQNKIDILCAMNQPSVDKFLPKVQPGGLALINTSIVTEKVERDDVKIIDIDATNIAVGVGSARVANMVMLAGFIKEAGLFTLEDVETVLVKRFGAKRPELIPLNIEAIKLGL
jgi:2-oxoglutarate ferredoxin oxidoreductase subunit gamma